MRGTKARALVFAAAILVTGTTMAGCDGTARSRTGESSQNGDVLAEAETATDASRSAEIDVTTTQFDGAPPLTVYASYDFQRQLGEVKSVESDGTTNGGAILDGNTIYTNTDPSAQTLPRPSSQTKWLKQPAQLTADGGDPLAGLLNPVPTGRMSTWLRPLVSIVKSVSVGGSAQIDGTDTTEYDLIVNAARVEQVVPTDPGATWGPVGPFQIWIDSHHRIRRIRIPLDIPGDGATTRTFDFKNFGVPVLVTVPRPGQVEVPPTDGT